MAELESSGETAGGLPVPSPDEALIRSQNARRLARRRQAASLALQIGQTSTQDLTREGDTRVVGGTFEELQEVPDREPLPSVGMSMQDLAGFFSALSFDPRQERLGRNTFMSSFIPMGLGLNLTAQD